MRQAAQHDADARGVLRLRTAKIAARVPQTAQDSRGRGVTRPPRARASTLLFGWIQRLTIFVGPGVSPCPNHPATTRHSLIAYSRRSSNGPGSWLTICTRVRRLWQVTILTLYVLAGGAASASQESSFVSFQNLGTFEYRTTTNGLLVAARHGTSNQNTDRLAMHVAASLGAGYVVAREFELRASILTPGELSIST